MNRTLAWQDKGLCNQGTLPHLLWEMLDHKNQQNVCNTPCPVRAICREYNDAMGSAGVVAGGRWYPITGRRNG